VLYADFIEARGRDFYRLVAPATLRGSSRSGRVRHTLMD